MKYLAQRPHCNRGQQASPRVLRRHDDGWPQGWYTAACLDAPKVPENLGSDETLTGFNPLLQHHFFPLKSLRLLISQGFVHFGVTLVVTNQVRNGGKSDTFARVKLALRTRARAAGAVDVWPPSVGDPPVRLAGLLSGTGRRARPGSGGPTIRRPLTPQLSSLRSRPR